MRPRLLLLAAIGWLLGGWPGEALGAAPAWGWPLPGVPAVERGFDPPGLPWLAGHRGVDLRARVGDRVLAAGGGRVGFAGTLAGRGVLTIHHPTGLETTYEPVTPAVHVGATVTTGDVIGHLAAGHGQCGPGFDCLHWGLRDGARYLDPRQLIGPVRVRLLPVFGPMPPDPWARRDGEARPAGADSPAPRSRGHPASTSTSTAAAAALGLVAVGGAVMRRRGR